MSIKEMKMPVILFMVILVILLVACRSNDELEKVFTGIIKEVNEHSAIVTIEDGDILNSGTEANVDLSVADETTFQIGDKVRVGYRGDVRETHPLGIDPTFVERVE
ncbi:hypothetical protein ACS127_14390 [Amphibacillus sp. Q70]|uniref:hypothetical protein n=1 Tax=Amphibacillus sp. Q70 TaxID=3453416 RepID=UPI003F82580E